MLCASNSAAQRLQNVRKLVLGAAYGIAAGYAAIRLVQAAQQWTRPTYAAEKDPLAYSHLRRSLSLADTARSTAAFVAFAYGPLGDIADEAAGKLPKWAAPAALTGAAALGAAMLELPTSYVEDYALERHYGLTDQSQADWVAEYAKSAAISTGITAILGMLFGIAVRRAPERWPLLATIGVFPLFVAGNIIVPLYLMPLFNTFEPVTGSLEDRIRNLAARYGVGDAEILRMDMSKQTRKANAFVTGIGHTHRIVLGDTLIANFPEDETTFVVAHELGHYVTKDTWRLIALGEVLALVLFSIANGGISQKQREALRDRPLLVARLYALMLIATQLLRPLLFAFSRSREWAADRFAIAATSDPAAGICAFRRLRDQNLADDDPPSWYEFFFASHPSLKARIAALERLEGAGA
jgi:STE24 endopeptidase